MGNHSSPPDVSADDLKQARSFWDNFVKYSKYSILAIIAFLILLAVTLL